MAPAVGHHPHPPIAAGGGVGGQLPKTHGYPGRHLLRALPHGHVGKVGAARGPADPGLIAGVVLELLVVH